MKDGGVKYIGANHAIIFDLVRVDLSLVTTRRRDFCIGA